MQNSTEREAGADESRGGATIEDKTDLAAQRQVITPIGGSAFAAADRDAGFRGSNCQREQFHGGHSPGRQDAVKAPGGGEFQG